MSLTTLRILPLLIVLAVACGSDSDRLEEPTESAADSVTRALDPGDGEDGWRAVGARDVGSIETAWQVGTATQSSPYVEATVSSETGKAFFVFRAALDEIQLVLQAPSGDPFVESVRLFVVTAVQRGAEVTPSWSVPHGGTWSVVQGEVYVVEVTGPKGAFF